MNETILEQLESFSLDDYRPIYPRRLDLGEPLEPHAGNLVKVVVGMRRSGKSYRLLQEIDRLIESGVPRSRICYFNFDDDRLTPVTGQTGDEVLEAFYSLNPDALAEGAYLFFDELQEMENWGSWLRRVLDTHKATIYVSGSSSTMLSREISTEFRGRALDFELLPYSFAEYVAVRAPGIAPAKAYSIEERLRLAALCEEYLSAGGFPATLGMPKTHSVQLLQSYAQQVVARDVVERHGIARARVASLFAQRVLSTNAKPLSVRKIESDLRAIGLNTSRELLGDMLSYFEQAFLVFCVRDFTCSLSEGSRKMPKVYAVDPGLALANARANSLDVGQRLEDAVYLELRRRNFGTRRDGIATYVTRGHGFEVDFVVGDALSRDAFELYQVCANADDAKTRGRELRALWEALEESGLDEATLVVLDGKAMSHERNGKRVNQVPAWKWLMGSQA